MKWDKDGQCFVAENADWLKGGWMIVGVARFKPGVQVVSVRRELNAPFKMNPEMEFRQVYVPDELTPWHGVQ